MTTVTIITQPTETEVGIDLGPTIAAGNHAAWNLMIVTEIRPRIQTLVLLLRSTESTNDGRIEEVRPPGDPGLIILMIRIVKKKPAWE